MVFGGDEAADEGPHAVLTHLVVHLCRVRKERGHAEHVEALRGDAFDTAVEAPTVVEMLIYGSPWATPHSSPTS